MPSQQQVMWCIVAVLALGSAVWPVAARKIEDCCCEAETVDVGNDQELHARLQELREQTFFRIFKVDLHSECPFWHQESVCHRQGCSVCPCEEHEIPEMWKEEEKQAAAARPKAPVNPWSIGAGPGAKQKYKRPPALNKSPPPGAGAGAGAGGAVDEHKTALVDRTLAPTDPHHWSESDDTVWIEQHSTGSGDSDSVAFIDLLRNPEGYTGYEGKEAWRIWESIYLHNCFRQAGQSEEMCLEQRVLYRLISGLQSAIAAHTAARYDLEPGVVGPSQAVFEAKLGAHPERVQNLYFAFVFLLRAVHKASPLLEEYSYSTGNLANDLRVKHMMRDLLDSRIVRSCLPDQSFDETGLFSRPDTKPLKAQFKEHFRNISSIMDCVSCEKCKLHGKLQVLGLGTALRILFSERSLSQLSLQRNEVIALVVTLAKFSHAIRLVHEFEAKNAWYADPNVVLMLIAAVVSLVLAAAALLLLLCAKRRCRFRLRLCRSRRSRADVAAAAAAAVEAEDAAAAAAAAAKTNAAAAGNGNGNGSAAKPKAA